MGVFAEKVKKLVDWVGDIFARVIDWFVSYMTEVNDKTEKFLNKNEKKILKCNDPKSVAKYMAAKSDVKQIEKIAERTGENLDPDDKAEADKMIEEGDFE